MQGDVCLRFLLKKHKCICLCIYLCCMSICCIYMTIEMMYVCVCRYNCRYCVCSYKAIGLYMLRKPYTYDLSTAMTMTMTHDS